MADSPLTREQLRAMPKADLHVHIDGGVRPATILDLAAERNHPLPADDPETLATFVTVSPGCRSLADFLKTFDVFYPLLTGPQAVERIARELVEDEAADGVTYVEARFAPVLQATPDAPIESVVDAALRGLEAGSRAAGIRFGLILCCYRSEAPESSLETFSTAMKFRDRGVVGLDLAGDETNFPALPHLEPFAAAYEAGLPVTVHAGEAGPVENIREALTVFGARRLGHAVRLADDARLMRLVADRAVVVESCLTSNVQTGVVPSYEAHPMARFLEAGVPVVLNTDDPAVCRTSLSAEFEQAQSTFGLGDDALRRIARTGFEAAFAPRETVEALLSRFDQWWKNHDR